MDELPPLVPEGNDEDGDDERDFWEHGLEDHFSENEPDLDGDCLNAPSKIDAENSLVRSQHVGEQLPDNGNDCDGSSDEELCAKLFAKGSEDEGESLKHGKDHV